MKKHYLLPMILGIFIFFSNHAMAQEFPWPDLGDPMIIEPGAPGVINETIMGDTTANGERNHNHYILKRGATYLYTARILNNGYPLMVTAEDGDGELPIIKAVGPAPGEDEAERPFHAQGDLYLKDITINGFDQGGNYTDNATVRLAADSITVVLNSVNFDFNRQNNLRVNASACSVYVENCIIANQGVAARLYQGFAITFRGNYFEVIHMRNNTIYNMHGTAITSGSPARYNKFIFENNTVVNTGAYTASFGRPDTLVVKNNLWVNNGIMGDGIQGDRENFVEPWFQMSIDSTFNGDTVNPELVDPMLVDFRHNYVYLDPAIAELLPDSSNKATDTFFHPYLADLMGISNYTHNQAFTFNNFPAEISEYQAYIDDFYQFSDDPAEMPLFNTDFRTLDFTYSESHPAATASSDAGPLGDRNWFPDFVPTNTEEPEYNFVEVSVYPNPVKDFVRMDNLDESTDVYVLNTTGQRVMHVPTNGNTSMNLDISDLAPGIYIISFQNESNVKGIRKIMKQ